MRHKEASLVPFAATCGFLAGMAVMAGLLALFRIGAPETATPIVQAVASADAAAVNAWEGEESSASRDDAAGGAGAAVGTSGDAVPAAERRATAAAATVVDPPPPRAVPVRASGDETVIAAAPSADGAPSADEAVRQLRARQLDVPLRGVGRTALRSSFTDARGGTRRHEAIDLLAPRHTPIVAVEDGVIARLFESKAGGITIYQFDPSTTYVYYYAHLERYAPGLEEGARVGRGQVIGYVGTSGNAPKDTPHLHFAIFVLTGDKRWWQGTPIDPFEVLK